MRYPSLLTCLAVICWAMLGATFYSAWTMIIGDHWIFDAVFALIWLLPLCLLPDEPLEEPEPPEVKWIAIDTEWEYLAPTPATDGNTYPPIDLEYYCDVCGTHYPADDPCPWH